MPELRDNVYESTKSRRAASDLTSTDLYMSKLADNTSFKLPRTNTQAMTMLHLAPTKKRPSFKDIIEVLKCLRIASM